VIRLGYDATDMWMVRAECRKPEQSWKFYQDDFSDRYVERQAKAVCRECPVATQCLYYALSEPEPAWGIWGGTNEAERARLRTRRNP
jgi:WhiB family redox-sensing transcriptional regulator